MMNDFDHELLDKPYTELTDTELKSLADFYQDSDQPEWHRATVYMMSLRAELTRVTAERDWAYEAFNPTLKMVISISRLAINVCEMDPELARLDLNACLECCSELPEAFQNLTKTKVATRAELLAELAEARRDAERYRTVRDLMMHEHRADAAGWTLSVLLPGDDPDAAIDAARSES